MINFGLKLWTNNTEWFDQALNLYKDNKVNFIELYYNDNQYISLTRLMKLRGIPINIHSTDNYGFEDFKIGKQELKIWKKITELANLLKSDRIIIHPGRRHTFETFKFNLERINDPRILIENMAGLDINNRPMYASKLVDLESISKIENICFDFEKAVKSAVYQNIDYKKFITECLDKLTPFYFHVSGGNKDNPRDEHNDLWESNFDVRWIKGKLLEISGSRNIFLVFETPKKPDTLDNDILNFEYFKKL